MSDEKEKSETTEWCMPDSLAEKCKQKDKELEAKRTVAKLQNKEEEPPACSLDDMDCESCSS